MSEYRNRTSGAVNTQGEIRRSMPNTSLPRVWTSAICDSLGIDPVLAAPAPEASGEYKVVSRNGVTQDALGNWVEAYTERDMFADYTDEEGVTVTKAEQEQAYTARKNEEAATAVRSERDKLLAETDWRAGSDLTMSDAWKVYRQALRDVTAQTGFPHEVTFPTKPE